MSGEPWSTLSPRETEILQLLADGATTRDVAEKLGISVLTVRQHRQNINQRLGMHTGAGAAAKAIRLGIIK